MRQGRHVAWLVVAVVLITGCGSPATDIGKAKGNADSSLHSAFNDGSHTPDHRQKSAGVTTDSAMQDGAGATALPAVFAEDLKYTPPYAYLVAVIRPAKMAELEGIRGIPGADWAGPNPVKPSEIERALMTVYPCEGRREMGEGELGVAFVLRFHSGVPRDRIVSWLSPNAKPAPDDKKIYFNPNWNDQSLVLGFPDDRTVFASRDPNFVFRRIQSAGIEDDVPHALAAGFACLDPEAQAAAVVDMDKLDHFVRVMLSDGESPLPETLKPFRSATLLRLAVNLAKPDGFCLRVENRTTGDNNQLGYNAKQALAVYVKKVLADFNEYLGEAFTEHIESVARRSQALIEATTVRHDGNAYTIQSQQLPAPADSLRIVQDFGALNVARLRRQAADLLFRHHMRGIGLGIHEYFAVRKAFPRDIVSPSGKPLLSWRVAILPYIQERDLYNQFHLDEPWDSERNLRLLKEMPEVYHSRDPRERTKTSIQWATGTGTGRAARRFEEIKSTGRTLALVESQQLVEWTRPGDFLFDSQGPAKGLRHGGAFGVMYDGSEVYLSPTIDPTLLRAAFLSDDSDPNVDQLHTIHAVPGPMPLTDEQLDQLLPVLATGAEVEVVESLRSLGKFQRKSPHPRSQFVLDKVTPLLHSESPLVRAGALRAILAWRAGATVDRKTVAKLLNDRYEANRWFAIDILSHFAEPELAQAMLRLPEQDWAVAGPIIYQDYATIALDAAVPLLNDPDPSVRARACYVIGNMGNDSHITQLRAILFDDHEACRQAAQKSLDLLQRKGPLAAAVEEFNGDIVAALKKVAKDVKTDEEGNVVALDLEQHRTPYHLVRSDFPLLARLRSLKSVRLEYSSITAEGLGYLQGLPLETLSLRYCPRIDDVVADELRTMTTLKVLGLDETKVGDRTAKAIGQLKNLEDLSVGSTQVTDVGLAHLGRLSRLKHLDLSGTDISDKGLVDLFAQSGFPELLSLHLAETRISDKGLAAIAGHPKLVNLYLMELGINDSAIEHLVTLKNLRFVNLSGAGLTAEGRARLRTALPHCRVLAWEEEEMK